MKTRTSFGVTITEGEARRNLLCAGILVAVVVVVLSPGYYTRFFFAVSALLGLVMGISAYNVFLSRVFWDEDIAERRDKGLEWTNGTETFAEALITLVVFVAVVWATVAWPF